MFLKQDEFAHQTGGVKRSPLVHRFKMRQENISVLSSDPTQCYLIGCRDSFIGFCNAENKPLKEVNWENRNLKNEGETIIEFRVTKKYSVS